MPGTLHEIEAETTAPALRSVALIGPDEARRSIMARALANSGGATFREYLAYPTRLGDLPRLLEQNYDMFMIDVDSDESCALTLVAKLAAGGVTVMAYSRRHDQELILRCMQAGARDFLPLPAEEGPAAAEPGAEGELHAPTEEEAALTTSTSTAQVAPVPTAPAVQEPVAVRTPSPAAPSMPEFEDLIFRHVGVDPPPRKGRSKRLLVAASISMVLTAGLAFAFLPQLQPARTGLLSRFGVHAAGVQPSSAAPAASPAPATPAETAAPQVAAAAVPAADASAQQPATRDAAPPATPSAPSMGSQLSAPSRISGDLKKPQPREQPAAGFAPSGLESASAAPGAAFASRNNVKVMPAVTAISAGVAAGMLIHRTEPIYPQIARTSRISGTVVLAATISRTGAIENLRVLSGPVMLRQAAFDAVRTWRYRPYKLNNEPIAVDTTISVIFSADR